MCIGSVADLRREAAIVVTSVLLIRYLSEFLWQYTAIIRRYYLRLRVDWTASADGNDPFTDEANRTLLPSKNSLKSHLALIVMSLVGLLLVLWSSSMAIDALIAGGVVFWTEYVYIKLWAGYYTDLLNIDEPLVNREKIEEEMSDSGQKKETDAALRSAFDSLVDNKEVAPERLARELKVYHEDPRYGFQIGEDGQRMTELLELIEEGNVDPEQLVEKFCLAEHQTREANTEAS
jgi:hypothetical protein